MIGKTISHYKILEKLGEGGMGVVYRAVDLKLRRDVALKFLPTAVTRDEEANERFIREAQAAAALNHPNICTIHEIEEADGQTFIAMEHVDGESLYARIRTGALDLDEALDIAAQIAGGLAEAHEKGIVHRDIKPANVMLASGGRVKIMDFGLARLVGGAELTRAGTTVGTVAYMSPEQARGRDVDERTDIWSLGVVLYEMLTGTRPFQGDHEQAIIRAILNDKPAPVPSLRPEVSVNLAEIVHATLAKDPSNRYQTARDVVEALRGTLRSDGFRATVTRAQSPGSRPTIAVLPFADMSPEQDQEYFCDGVAEEIINALTRVSGVRVIARSSAFAFRGRDQDVREVGRSLSATTVLEGSVRKAGNRLRITAQLIDAGDGCHIWSERYDRDLEDVFAIQDEIAATIAEKLEIELTPQEERRLGEARKIDPEAHEAYLRGHHYWISNWQSVWLDPSRSDRVIRYFEKAIEKDPEYALAYAGLADVWSSLCRWSSQEGCCEKARTAALRALELDETLAEAHTAMGHVYLSADLDWDAAREEHERAVELNPGSAAAHRDYGTHLSWEGRGDEAIAEAMRAAELDPLDYFTMMTLAFVYHGARRHADATACFERVIDLFPGDQNAKAEREASRVYERIDIEQSIAALESMKPHDMRLGIAYAWQGRRDDALCVLDWWKDHETEDTIYRIARIHAALGEKDLALHWLEKTLEERPRALLQINSDPELDYLRPDPRFRDLMLRSGIPSGQLQELAEEPTA